MNRPSPYIWCPINTFVDPKTKTTQQDSIGPNQHVNLCLLSDCTCEELEDKVEELERYRHGHSD